MADTAIRQASNKNGIQIIELEVMDDHVHCFVDIPPTMSVSKVLQLLKGYSAYMIFKHHPWLRRHFRTGHLRSPVNLQKRRSGNSRRHLTPRLWTIP